MNKRFGGFIVIVILAVFCGMFALAVTSHAMMKSTGIVRSFDAKNFAEKFAAAYQAGDLDKLALMYAPTVEVGRQLLTKVQLRQGLAQGLKRPNGSIRGIIIIEGLDSFTEVSPGKFTGKITFQLTYLAGGATKSSNLDFDWTVAHSDGGGDWQIVKTDRLSWDWGNK